MKKKIAFYSTLVGALCFLFVSCGTDGGTGSQNQDSTENSQEDTTAPTVKLSEFSTSPEFPDAKISMAYKGGKFSFNVLSDTYQLGLQTSDAPQKMCANSADGQHIHLIVDNQPYDALYKPEFDKEVADGEHYILAFLSRSYHESIKTPTAYTLVHATVQGNTIAKSEPVSNPMVFYSRPKGKYVGKAETDKVMLDFYLHNVVLSPDGIKVKVLVNGETEFVLDSWKPYYLEGLPIGENRIQLTLIDNDGNAIQTPLNPVERVFTLVADPME